jgi:membrane protein DedA with SNARE-associated domain
MARTSITSGCETAVTVDGFLIGHGGALILPLAVIEGPVVSVLTGFLSAQGYVDWRWALFLLVCGDLIGDLICYGAGYAWVGGGGAPLAWLGRRAGLGRVLTPELQRGLTDNAAKMLLIGKWTHAIGWIVLVGSGMLRRPLPGFILVNLLASVPKSAALFGIGYFAGNDYPLLARHSGLAMLGLTAVGVAAVVLVLRRADRIGAGG